MSGRKIPKWLTNHWLLYNFGTLVCIGYIILIFLSLWISYHQILILSALPVFIFVVLPFIDHFTKDAFIPYCPRLLNSRNFKGDNQNDISDVLEFQFLDKSIIQNHIFYKIALVIYTFAFAALLLFTLTCIKLNLFHKLSLPLFSLLCLNTGLMSTISFGVAHELIHKLNLAEWSLGMILLGMANYSHFYIQHIFGHHKTVGTIDDVNTARYNETVYQFFPRSIFGGYWRSWQIEFERLDRLCLPVYKNKMIPITVVTILVPFIVFKLFGFMALLFFFGQSFIGIIFTETINYIEHYGLERRKMKTGRYEKISERDSWDCPFRYEYIPVFYFIF